LQRHEKRRFHFCHPGSAPDADAATGKITAGTTLLDDPVPLKGKTQPQQLGWDKAAFFEQPEQQHDQSLLQTTDDDNLFALNWPDTEDLLQTILSSELAALPRLDVNQDATLPPMMATPQGESLSPWVDRNAATEPDEQGGSAAVSNLSQIITEEVGGHFTKIVRGELPFSTCQSPP
jgi:hypothetical protein